MKTCTKKLVGRAILPAAGFSAGLGERSSPALPRVAARQAKCLRHEGRCGSWVFDRAAGFQTAFLASEARSPLKQGVELRCK